MFIKGYKMTEDHKMKISLAHKAKGELHWGKRPEVKEKIRQSINLLYKNGLITSNKGKKSSKEQIAKMVATRNKNGSYRKATQEERYKRKMSAPRGEKHYNWKGGITSINAYIRNSLEFRLWREAVYKRDNFTCQECKKIGGKLNAHHIKPFSLFPELRFAIDNGITLCKACHIKTDTFAGKVRNYSCSGY